MMHGAGPGLWRMTRPNDLDKDKKLPKGLVRRVFRFARHYRLRMAGAIVTIIAASALGVTPPLILKSIIDHLVKFSKVHPDLRHVSSSARGDMLNFVGEMVLVYIGIQLTAAAFGLLMRYLLSGIGEGIIFDLRSALYNHVQRMPVAFFTRTQTGALISRLNNDVIGAQRAVAETTPGLVQVLGNIIATLVAMFILQPRLTLLALVVVPLFVLPTRKMGKVLQNIVRKQMDQNASMNTQMTERFQIGGALLVKLFGNYEGEHREFSGRAAAVRDLGIRQALYARMFFASFMLVASMGTALSYWMGGRFVVSGVIGIGTIFAFSQYLAGLYMPITGLSNVPVDLKTSLVSFDRVFEVLDFPSFIQERATAVELVDPKGAVEFRNVKFRYPKGSDVSIPSLEEGRVEMNYNPDAYVLRDVSFKIEPGHMVALVGPSGAGKTTISMLLPRLYDVTDGSVLIDGNDVRDYTLESVAAAVGTVTQDAHMFHETIRSNLLYAKPGATEDEMIEAAKAAQIHNLIASLPDGYDTLVGERGYRLSGGEKQRLAIARLLLKDPAIMILDEATAHLDSESELLIQRALARALSGRSSLVIAHRLSTIVKADQILVIDEGRIVERGRHFELMNAGGLYEELYRTQFERATLEAIEAGDGITEPSSVASPAIIAGLATDLQDGHE